MSLFSFLRGKPVCELEEDTPGPVLEYPFGEPDEVIVVNPERVNNPDGVILFYREKGLLYYDNKAIPVKEIVDITSLNAANPYLPGDYQIVIKLRSNETHRISVADGPESVNEILLKISNLH